MNRCCSRSKSLTHRLKLASRFWNASLSVIPWIDQCRICIHEPLSTKGAEIVHMFSFDHNIMKYWMSMDVTRSPRASTIPNLVGRLWKKTVSNCVCSTLYVLIEEPTRMDSVHTLRLETRGNTVICSLTYPSLVPLVGLDLGYSLPSRGSYGLSWSDPGSVTVDPATLGSRWACSRPSSTFIGVSRCRVSFFSILVIHGIHFGNVQNTVESHDLVWHTMLVLDLKPHRDIFHLTKYFRAVPNTKLSFRS